MNLRTDFEELLPTTARAVIDLGEVRSRLLSIDSLGVLIFSDDVKASKRFVDDLAGRLQKAPPDVISSVEYRIDKELAFFKSRQALFIDAPDLTRIRHYITDRIDYEKSLYNPLNIFNGADLEEPKLDFEGIKNKYKKGVSTYERFPDGYYATPDEKKRVILVYVPGQNSGVASSQKLKATVEQAVADLQPASYAPDLEVKYTGGVQDGLEEHHALIEDLTLSTIIVTLLVSAGMWIFYRNLRATLALVISLFMGTFWTFGVSYFAEGYLNANSAFLGSIVIGNGINFGIIYLARYMEERRHGRGNSRATLVALETTATSTGTAALAAGLSYGSLALTSFRGFKQFGVIGLIGMVLCWISAYTLLPAYLTLLDRIRPLVKKGAKEPRSIVAAGIAALVRKFPGPIWLGSIFITVVSLALLTRYDSSILETDLSKLRNKQSLISGSAYLSRYLDEIFQRYLSPLVILPKTLEETQAVAARLRAEKEAEGEHSLIASVQTLADFAPKDQAAKIRILNEIRHELPPQLVQRLGTQDQKTVSEFLTRAVFAPIQVQGLPPLVLSKFTERDGSVGKLVLIEPPLNNELWKGENLIAFTKKIRDAADSVRPGTAVAGTLTITSDMIEAVARDGPKATLFALCAVVLLVFVLFRDFKTSGLVLFSLFMGVIWLAGLILGLHFKINFLNFIALPITFGIGVDYGVNIFQRYSIEARAKGGVNQETVLRTIRNTGGAVMLCSFSTVTGYVSLLIAGNQGFVSFGKLAVAGELTCVTAALVSLPAFLILRARRAAKKAARASGT
jgi:predicted RND superfamily exporter protein